MVLKKPGNQKGSPRVDTQAMRRKVQNLHLRFLVSGLMPLLPWVIVSADEPRWTLDGKDVARIEAEIDAFGLADSPEIDSVDAALVLPGETKSVVLRGGGISVLESLARLENLESLYLVIGEINEADLAALEALPNLKRLCLGMAGRYRIRHDLWEPLGKLVALEQLDIRCHP